MKKDYSSKIRTVFENFSPILITSDYNELEEKWGQKHITFDDYKIHYITNGTVDVNIFGEIFHLEEGSLMLVPSKTTAFYCEGTIKNVERYWCSAEINFPKNLLHFSKENIITKCDRDVIVPVFEKLIKTSDDNSISGVVTQKICLLEIFTIFFNSFELDSFFVEEKDDFYNRVRNYIDEHICESLHPKDLAKYMNLEQSYFTRIFKEHFFEAPVKYINKLKLKKCTDDLLLKNDLTIEQIANENGFSDYRYFTRVFKKRYGVSPLTYKKTSQKNPQISKN